MSEARTEAAAPAAACSARAFVREHAARVAPVLRASHLAEWEIAVGGGPAAVERTTRARAEFRRLHSDPEALARVREWLAADGPADPLLRRQLVLLELQMTGNQLPAATIDDLARREGELEHVFVEFRAELDGERVTNNRLLDILRDERDPAVRRRAWEASKGVGREVAERLRELVRRRNAAARTLGFSDFYTMDLALQELPEERLFAVLDDFAARTDEPFRRLRASQDERLARRFGTRPEELRPWHWSDPFAQEAPCRGAVDLDTFFAGASPEDVAGRFFAGIGLATGEILARSDLYEREGKDQHAFCIDIDRAGDVRILCNLRPNEKWTGTLLHELGHAVYNASIPTEVPFLLRTQAHILSTEGVAMFFGRLTRDPVWLRDEMGAALSAEETDDVRAQLRASLLVSTRWMLVMAHFERALYRDPDRPDLNRLWWDLVERFQRVRRPEGRDEPDWAAKKHLTTSPVYYHNYLMGEMMASQLGAALRRLLPEGAGLSGRPEVGAFFRERVFAPGASVDWNELALRATGKPLTARDFVEDMAGAA